MQGFGVELAAVTEHGIGDQAQQHRARNHGTGKAKCGRAPVKIAEQAEARDIRRRPG